jgi:hypothetical protein
LIDPLAFVLRLSLHSQQAMEPQPLCQFSRDSRYDGPSKIDDIIGVARSCYWPPTRWKSY